MNPRYSMDMHFREYVQHTSHADQFAQDDGYTYTDLEVANLYYSNYPGMKVKEIAIMTDRSVGEMYRILHRHGQPNRLKQNYSNVLSFHDAGLGINQIAELTGYTPRNVRYILKSHLMKEG